MGGRIRCKIGPEENPMSSSTIENALSLGEHFTINV